MNKKFLDYDLLQSLNKDLFILKYPFPWLNFNQFLTSEVFKKLNHDFPRLNYFEKHKAIKRVYGQKPHDRYYLAYEKSNYHLHNRKKKGIVKLKQLPKSWQRFMEELETSLDYQNFIKSLFEVSDFRVRYAWHVGVTNSDVSPHIDDPKKIGTHILYFNTSEDWNPDWGGSTLILGGKLTNAMNPDFTDFTTITPTQFLDNFSFIFKNTPNAWHGVKPLTCPQGKYRRIFNIIFEFSDPKRQLTQSSLQSELPVPWPKKLVNKIIKNLAG
ncbi:MAG: 2OG-Fe(II) oxygenase [Moorea sp. SIO3G5]|nr:2OG-Fe(II) oxygenase [Moorena sp. SIO3G5]